MTTPIAQFTFDFRSNAPQTVGATSASLANLQSELDASTTQIRRYQGALSTLKAGGQGSTEQAKSLQAQLYAARGEAAKTQSQILALGGSLERTRPPPLAPAQDELKRFAKGAGLGEDSVERLRIAMGSASVRGVIFAGVLTAVAAGAARLAISAAASRQNELLDLSQIGDGARLQSVLDSVARAVPQTREELVKLAQSLPATVRNSQSAQTALRALAVAQAGGGDTALAAARQQIAAAGSSSRAILSVGAAIDQAYGDRAQARFVSLSVQATRLKSNLLSLFEGASIGGLGAGLVSLNRSLERGSVLGGALRQVFATLTQPLVSALAGGSSATTRFVEGFTLAIQEIVIAGLTLRNGVARALAGTSIGEWLKRQNGALFAGRIALYTLGAVATLAVVSVGALALPAIKLVAAGALIVSAFQIVRLSVAGAWKYLSEIKWGDLAVNIIDGLANGMLAGLDRVGAVFRRMADAGVNAFKGAMGIRSPSARMRETQGYVSDGVVVRADQDRSRVEAAYVRAYVPSDRVRAEISRPLPTPRAVAAPVTLSPAPRPAAGGAGLAVTIASGAFQINVSGDGPRPPREIAEDILDEIERKFEFRLRGLIARLA